MAFTKESMLHMDKPYQTLGKDSDILIAHKNILDSLSDEEGMTLACKMVLECPDKELRQFKNNVKGLGAGIHYDDGFSVILQAALHAKSQILSLLDPRNRHVIKWLGHGFNLKIYQQFKELSDEIIEQHAQDLALVLVSAAKTEEQIDLLKNNITPLNSLKTHVDNTLLVRQQIEALKGDDPYEALIKINADLAVKYPKIVIFNLASHEEDIAEKLSNLDNKKRTSVILALGGLTGVTYDNQDLFQTIRLAFDKKNDPITEPQKIKAKEEVENQFVPSGCIPFSNSFFQMPQCSASQEHDKPQTNCTLF